VLRKVWPPASGHFTATRRSVGIVAADQLNQQKNTLSNQGIFFD